MTPVPVPARDLHLWRDKIGWHLGSFCENGVFRPEDLIADIETGDRQLWIVADMWDESVKCVLLTCIIKDRLKTCKVTHCAGENFRAWVHLFDVIESWARAEGCQRIEAVTRPGWEKPLGRFGMAKTHVVLEKRL